MKAIDWPIQATHRATAEPHQPGNPAPARRQLSNAPLPRHTDGHPSRIDHRKRAAPAASPTYKSEDTPPRMGFGQS